jgi:hypothetical protein
VANNIVQISQLLDRVWVRTQAGELNWEQLSERSSFQTRLGDFVIALSGSPKRIFGESASANLTVKRLDGRIVANATAGASNALAFQPTADRLPPQSQETLLRLYNYLEDRNTDLDELLKILK